MERLEVVLKKASDKEIKEAVDIFLTSRVFEAQGHVLYLCKQFGENPNRNHFWQIPNSREFAVDYGNNIMHIVRAQLTPVSSYLQRQASKIPYDSVEDQQKDERLVAESLQALRHYLGENLVMHLTDKIDMDDSTLGVPSRRIYNDIVLLNVKTGFALGNLKDYGVRNPHFLFRAWELVDYHDNFVKDFYDKANNELRLRMVH